MGVLEAVCTATPILVLLVGALVGVLEAVCTATPQVLSPVDPLIEAVCTALINNGPRTAVLGVSGTAFASCTAVLGVVPVAATWREASTGVFDISNKETK
jgi:hypothetical protein